MLGGSQFSPPTVDFWDQTQVARFAQLSHFINTPLSLTNRTMENQRLSFSCLTCKRIETAIQRLKLKFNYHVTWSFLWEDSVNYYTTVSRIRKNKEKWILFWYLQQLQGQLYKGLAIWLCLLFYEYSTTVVQESKLESQIKMQSNYGI